MLYIILRHYIIPGIIYIIDGTQIIYIIGVRSPQNVNYIYNLRQMTPKLNLHILFDLTQHVAQKIADKITILITEI